MNDEIITLEPLFRTTAFVATIALLLISERLWPRRVSRSIKHALTNVGLMITNTVLARLISSTSVVGFSLLAADNGWGLFNVVVLPGWLEVAAAIVLLDFAIYVQHRLFHLVPWLWRFHAVHHADRAFDVTTAVRFHPGEIVISLGYKIGLVFLIGPAALAALLFEALLSSASLFNHANLKLPHRVDAAIRTLIVTPDMHRIHHSVEIDEHNRNFGFLASWWDRLFGTYRDDPRATHEEMPIGLEGLQDASDQTYGALLRQPFTGSRSS